MNVLRIALAAFAAALLLVPARAAAEPCGGFAFLPDAPGKVTVSVTKGGYESYYLLGKEENASFNGSLKDILDVILDQPYLKPPRGAELRGWLRNWHSPLCRKEPCRGVPVNGQGIIFFHFLFESKGKAAPIIVTDNEIDIWINDPEAAVGANRIGITDSRGRRVTLQTPRIGEINGAARYGQGGGELLVLTRSDRPWWLPVSREEALKGMIRSQEQEIAKTGPISDAPQADVYRKWLAERPQRLKDAQQIYGELKKSNPAVAEQVRQQNEKLEAEMTERFRRDSEKEAARGTAGGPGVKLMNFLNERLERHREALAAMTPGERAAPARFMRHEDPREPELAPFNSSEGVPMIVVNTDFLDRSLPRTAIQIIVLQFGAPWADPAWMSSCAGRDPSMLLKHEVVTKTDWGKIIKMLQTMK